MPSDFAILLAVPSGSTAIGQPFGRILLATFATVPSPPATATMSARSSKAFSRSRFLLEKQETLNPTREINSASSDRDCPAPPAFSLWISVTRFVFCAIPIAAAASPCSYEQCATHYCPGAHARAPGRHRL